MPLGQSKLAIEAWRREGCQAELFSYDGEGDSHALWIEGSEPHRLLPELETAIRKFMDNLQTSTV